MSAETPSEDRAALLIERQWLRLRVDALDEALIETRLQVWRAELRAAQLLWCAIEIAGGEKAARRRLALWWSEAERISERRPNHEVPTWIVALQEALQAAMKPEECE